MPRSSDTPWKLVAVALALVLAVVLICVALFMTDVIALTKSLL